MMTSPVDAGGANHLRDIPMNVKGESVSVRCNLCGKLIPAEVGNQVYDALVRGHSQWAWMCKTDFDTFGAGVGEGIGQEYTCKAVKKDADPVWVKTKG